jgi:hypothetical protein
MKERVSIGKMNRIFSDGVKIVASKRAGVWISFNSRKDKARIYMTSKVVQWRGPEV